MQSVTSHFRGKRSATARAAIVALTSLAAASGAHASLIFGSSSSLEGLGSYTGSMTWTYGGLGSGAGTLAISLTNTSPGANGGFLTGFAFNVVDGVGLSLTSAPNATWYGVSHVPANPFPNFDFGAALEGNWLGGHSPNPGIAAGSTGALTFRVLGNDALLASLSDASFFDTSNGYGFAARFRGFQDGGSDKVMGDVIVTPLPQTLGLAGAGVLGLIFCRRRG